MADTATQNYSTLVSDAYDAFNRQDVEAVAPVLHDDITWVEPEGVPQSGTFHGPSEVVEGVFGPAVEPYESMHLDVERIIDGGDSLVVVGSANGTVRATGEYLENRFAHLIDIEDGKISRFEQFTDTYRWQQHSGN